MRILRTILSRLWGLIPRNYRRGIIVVSVLLSVLILRWMWVSLTGGVERWHNVVALMIAIPILYVGWRLAIRAMAPSAKENESVERGEATPELQSDEPRSLDDYDYREHLPAIQPYMAWWRQIFTRGGK